MWGRPGCGGWAGSAERRPPGVQACTTWVFARIGLGAYDAATVAIASKAPRGLRRPGHDRRCVCSLHLRARRTAGQGGLANTAKTAKVYPGREANLLAEYGTVAELETARRRFTEVVQCPAAPRGTRPFLVEASPEERQRLHCYRSRCLPPRSVPTGGVNRDSMLSAEGVRWHPFQLPPAPISLCAVENATSCQSRSASHHGFLFSEDFWRQRWQSWAG